MALLEAGNAAKFTLGADQEAGEAGEQILVDKAEYERLLRCRVVVDAAIAKL
jgi:hypothetical protein